MSRGEHLRKTEGCREGRQERGAERGAERGGRRGCREGRQELSNKAQPSLVTLDKYFTAATEGRPEPRLCTKAAHTLSSDSGSQTHLASEEKGFCLLHKTTQ